MFRLFEIGEGVLLKANNVSDNEKQEIAKFFAKYEGPYIIQRKVGEATYILHDGITNQERGQLHTNDLILYKRLIQDEK